MNSAFSTLLHLETIWHTSSSIQGMHEELGDDVPVFHFYIAVDKVQHLVISFDTAGCV